MVIYKLIGRTNPFDWASSSKDVDLGLYRTAEAAAEAKRLWETKKDFSMDWKYIRIEPADLLG